VLLEQAPPPEDAFDLEHRVVAHAFRLYVHAAAGDLTPEQAFSEFDSVLALLPPVAWPAVCSFAGAVASVHARWDALDHFVCQAFDADPGSQFAFFGGQLLMFQGLVQASRGELDAGIASFVDGRARFRAVGGRSGSTTFQALLAELLARAGRVADAGEFAAGARLQTDETGEAWNEVTVCIAEAVVAHARGDEDRARDRLAAAIVTGHEQGAHALARRAEAVAAELA
jgi:hypothetical protein